VSPDLRQLIELQELDLEIQRIEDRTAKIPLEREETELRFNQAAAEYLSLQSRHDEVLEQHKRLEIELSETQAHHEKYKQDLMRVTNEKQYATALREIDASKRQIGALESEILRQIEESDKLREELTAKSPEMEQMRAGLGEELATLDAELVEVGRLLTELARRREELARTLPLRLFDTYDRMARTRRGQALAEVKDGTCTACRMKIRPKVMSDVRKGEQMITCESCGRILYYRPDSPQPAEAATNTE